MTPELSALADKADDMHHRDLEEAVVAHYGFETEVGTFPITSILDVVDEYLEHPTSVMAARDVRAEAQAYKVYLIAVARRRRWMARALAEADKRISDSESKL